MTTVNVRIHYATNDGDYRWQAVADQPRTLAWEGPVGYATSYTGVDADLVVCEALFSAFNRHDAPDQHPALDVNRLRSMSVGDVIEIVEPGNGRFYLCADFGFKPIEGIRS